MIHIYTDGGCSGNPGPGGWAYIIIRERGMANGEQENEIISEKWGAEPSTTNNRMELQAVISALEYLSGFLQSKEPVTVYTDSQYVQKGITLWINDWKKRGWKTSGKKPVKNLELWQKLDRLVFEISGKSPINWTWIKGHSGDPYNEQCDLLTRKAIANMA